MTVTPLGSDDRPHAAGADPLWAESWQFDFAAGDGSCAGFVALHRYPNLGVAWYWAHFLTDEGFVAVRDHEVPPPKAGLEVRTDGLWAELVCETPLEHWSGGLEAFGIRYDDPVDAWGDEWGERLAVGLDFEWELTGPPGAGRLPGPPGDPDGGFTQAGTMWGEVLVGPSERIPFTGTGLRSRRWGVADWWNPPSRIPSETVSESGEFPGGSLTVSGGRGGVLRRWSGGAGADGTVTSPLLADDGDRFDGRGIPVAAWGGQLLGVATLLVTGPKSRPARPARLARALCRKDDSYGWAEWLFSPSR